MQRLHADNCLFYTQTRLLEEVCVSLQLQTDGRILTSCQLNPPPNLCRSSCFQQHCIGLHQKSRRRRRMKRLISHSVWCVFVCSSVCGHVLLWCGGRSGAAVREVPHPSQRQAVALCKGRAQRQGVLAAGWPTAAPLPGGTGRRAAPLTAQQSTLCG